MEDEEQLHGGNFATVSRLGNTVRRSAGPWSAQIHRLLIHLRAQGILEVPQPIGFDPQGREILSFIPGEVGHFPTAQLRQDSVLIAAAQLLRRIHDASPPLNPDWLSGWQSPSREPLEVICHGDFAPYNCVFEADRLVGVIDFDNAHPGSRAWDLAYAIYRFAPVMDPSNPDSYGSIAEQCRRVQLFCTSYGLTARGQFVAILLARITAMADFLRAGAAKGDERILANIAAGHLDIYLTDAAYLTANQEAFRSALLS